MDGNRGVSVIVAKTSIACPPTPFLLRDMSDSLGQMIVIPDDKWDEVIKMLHRHEILFIDTDQGQFIYLPNSDVKNGVFELRPTE